MFSIFSHKGQLQILEVEIEKLSPVYHSSAIFLPPGEYFAKVLKPSSLYEKSKDGNLIPPVWHSFAFFFSLEEAQKELRRIIKAEFERGLHKKGISFEEKNIEDAYQSVKIIYL